MTARGGKDITVAVAANLTPNQLTYYLVLPALTAVALTRFTTGAIGGVAKRGVTIAGKYLYGRNRMNDKFLKLDSGEVFRLADEVLINQRSPHIALKRSNDMSAFEEVSEDEAIAPLNEAKEHLKWSYRNLEQMTKEELIVALANEMKDGEMYASHCSEIYGHVTNDHITKANTLPSEVIGEMERFWVWKAEEEEDSGADGTSNDNLQSRA